MKAPRSMFSLGFTENPFRGQGVGPLSFRLTREEIERSGFQALKRIPVPNGWTGTYPYIVKVNTEGEYIVNSDGTAQWLDYHNGHVGEPFQL